MSRKYNHPIVVRLEDICPTMDRQKFDIFRKFFDEMGIKPLLCVIPENRDPKLVKSTVDWGIAMHGTYHLATGKSLGIISGDVPTEYAGMSYDAQLKKLREGKHFLAQNGCDTEVFAAPNHSYDRNTLRACKKLGLNYISDGLSKNPYMLEGVKCIPATPFWKRRRSGVLTMCIYTNNENLDGRETIFDFLRTNLYHVISFEEACQLKTSNYFISRIQEKRNFRKFARLRNAARKKSEEQ